MAVNKTFVTLVMSGKELLQSSLGLTQSNRFSLVLVHGDYLSFRFAQVLPQVYVKLDEGAENEIKLKFLWYFDVVPSIVENDKDSLCLFFSGATDTGIDHSINFDPSHFGTIDAFECYGAVICSCIISAHHVGQAK